jgi:glycosyltransferase involved in cell wall biosynthesis
MEYQSFSFVAPAFNERQSLPELIAELHSVGKQLAKPYEILVVDDGSTDGTYAFLDAAAKSDPQLHPVILRRNFGKAAALAAAFRRSRGDVIVTVDADLQNDPAEIPKLIAKLNEGFDLVNGWKFDRPDSLEKRAPSRLFNTVTRFFTGVRLHDFNSAIKAYTRECAQHIELYGELHRYIPVLAASAGFRITEMQTHTRVRKYGETKYKGKRYFRGFFDLLTILVLTKYGRRPLHLFGGLGITLSIVGLGILLYLSIVHVFFHKAIGTRPLLTFGIFFALAGLQLTFTGFLAELLVRSSNHTDVPIRAEWNGNGDLR